MNIIFIFYVSCALLVGSSCQLWPPTATRDTGSGVVRLASAAAPAWTLSHGAEAPRAFRLAACSFQWQIRNGKHEDVPPAGALLDCPLTIVDRFPSKDANRLSVRIDCPDLWRWDDCSSVATRPDDEAYVLDVSVGGAVSISASHPLGVAWALQTLLQLIDRTPQGDLVISGLPIHIDDAPLLSYRGLLVDSARFHLSVAFMRRLLLWMSSTKLNVLHWHLSDDDAFPIRLSSAPELAMRDVEGQEQGIYTKDDLAEVVTMARAHGIRVIPEFDVPGHAGGWTGGHSGLVSPCPNFACSSAWAITLSSDAASIETLAAVLGELFTIFPDPLVHLGGDEVDGGCWQEALGSIVRARREFCVFEKKLHNIVRLHGKKVIRWQEHWEQTADPECAYVRADVYQMWRNFYPSSKISLPAARDGKQLISSVDWYLDANCFEWDTCWSTDPFKYLGLAPDTSAAVVGGEACVWEFSEAAWNTERNPFKGIYAIAGRLWTSPWSSTPSPTQDIHDSILQACHNAAARGLLASSNCRTPAPTVPLSATKNHKEDRARRKQRLCKRFRAIH